MEDGVGVNGGLIFYPVSPLLPAASACISDLSPLSSFTSFFGVFTQGVGKEVVVAVPASWWWLC